MATNQEQTDLPETVSREAHQRMTDERNALKQERDDLARTVKDMGYMDHARRHFAEKGVEDPDWAAEIALPKIHNDLGDVTEMSAIGEYLDNQFARLYPKTGDAKVEDVPTPDAVETPSFARPTPAAEGQPAAKKVYSTSDPEIKALIAANDRATLERMTEAGELVLRTTTPMTPG
ncbi:hypothetical protein ACFL0N_01770 [Pseudomonadota bacterium]